MVEWAIRKRRRAEVCGSASLSLNVSQPSRLTANSSRTKMVRSCYDAPQSTTRSLTLTQDNASTVSLNGCKHSQPWPRDGRNSVPCLGHRARRGRPPSLHALPRHAHVLEDEHRPLPAPRDAPARCAGRARQYFLCALLSERLRWMIPNSNSAQYWRTRRGCAPKVSRQPRTRLGLVVFCLMRHVLLRAETLRLSRRC